MSTEDTTVKSVVTKYSYLDLEVDPAEGHIFSYGWHSSGRNLKASSEKSAEIFRLLQEAQQAEEIVCGHNFRRFDLTHLTRLWPELNSILVVDTLELSVLAFPLEQSHRLDKGYKLSEYASNDPLKDAQETRRLLQECLRTFAHHPQPLRQMYVWLLSCGATDADEAYRRVFGDLGWKTVNPPARDNLPGEVLEGCEPKAIDALWRTHITTASFENRFLTAALLMWNYERNRACSKQPPSSWLSHLRNFPTVLETLLPLKPRGFTYHPYLHEFGHHAFKGIQEEAVQAITEGKNPLVLMPTGGGKSLCYQLPALMYYRRQSGLTVCISPLQALMDDQVLDLEKNRLSFATFINSSLSVSERSNRLDAVRNGQKGLLYISPEQLRSMSIRKLFRERPPVLWVIDEAHCISQWGQDFRPDYRYIAKFINELYTDIQIPLPALALLTATATTRVCEDIQNLFAKQSIVIAQTIGGVGRRENLRYEVVPTRSNKDEAIERAVKLALENDGCAIVYATGRKQAEALAEMLSNRGFEAKHYHGKTNKDQRREILKSFKEKELNVITATCAFGMGINRKDVRAVIHSTPSSSLENYIQESGRAGRDGKPADCILLFDEKDLDAIFFLKSLNQLSSADLINIFLSIRNLRNSLRPKGAPVFDDWFWVTSDKIYRSSELNEEFGSENEQRDTKIQVALHYLESFGLVERAENLSTYMNINLRYSSPEKSLNQFVSYGENNELKKRDIEQFERLILALHLAVQHSDPSSKDISLENLRDESGISMEELPKRLRELSQAGICDSKIFLTIVIAKGVQNQAKELLERYVKKEILFVNYLSLKYSDCNTAFVNPRKLATFLDANRVDDLRDTDLLEILEGWKSLGWLKIKRHHGGLLRIYSSSSKIKLMSRVTSEISKYQLYCHKIIDAIYQKIDSTLESRRGSRLGLQYAIEDILQDVTELPTSTEKEATQLKNTLKWLHEREFLRITEGLNLFQRAMKVKVTKGGAPINKIRSRYPILEAFYREQARKTHMMAQYGKLAEDASKRQTLVDDYFRLTSEQFEKAHPELAGDSMHRALLQEDYNAIIGPLNERQKAIVESEAPAIAVIAGPGSGKTRTIVHRIAYLIKVKRVSPERIVVLAYNRNAVRELRLRLQSLIGSIASRLRVFTFHGLASSLLGRALGENGQGGNIQSVEARFDSLLKDACNLLAAKEGEEREEIELRRLKLLGNIEHIFVDEYQDVTKDEYRLIQLVSGQGLSEENDRSVSVDLCVIGDDDQNIYGFRGANAKFIIQFQAEYKADKFLLVENYRSTESIITTANQVIQNNRQRCKQSVVEQVRINEARTGIAGEAVRALMFANAKSQNLWVVKQIYKWMEAGTPPNQIAVLAKTWDEISEIRALLERLAGIPTYALRGRSAKLTRQFVTHVLLKKLQSDPSFELSSAESVRERFEALMSAAGRDRTEPTVDTLSKIMEDIDRERGFGSEALSQPISTESIATSVYEFSESPSNQYTNENAVLVTSCHGAKGLEFSKVLLLTDGFSDRSFELEQERRLFYVSLTRAKEELVLCCSALKKLVEETNLNIEQKQLGQVEHSNMFIQYFDMTPSHVHLGSQHSRNSQSHIRHLHEGQKIHLSCNQYGNGWTVLSSKNGEKIGDLSREACRQLKEKGIYPGSFEFADGEVSVRYIYRHVKVAEDGIEILQDWYVVIPQIRIYRKLVD